MFWNSLNNFKNNISIIDTSVQHSFSYSEIIEKSDKLVEKVKSDKKRLVFLFCDNSYASIIAYIALLRSGHAQLLLENKINKELKNELIRIYQPEIIISGIKESIDNYYTRNDDGIYISECKKKCDLNIHVDLGVLLSTSGTTGSPKLVRLSYKNIQSNAESISNYLKITENEKPITSLPMSYSYGLSVINSHLLSGATIVLTNQSIVLRDFWNLFRKNNCTSFAGVPYSFQLLKKTNFNKLDLPSLKTVTQAGGRLSEEYINYFYNLAKEKHFKFYVMYGQTEATARISYLPFDILKDKVGSVGISIPNGEIKIIEDGKEILSPQVEGELVYYGKNVMMGYAESRECLQKDDELNGVLYTNDIGYKDEDGFIFITGRKKRFIKIFGLRINLDEVEKMVENNFYCPAACFGNDDSLKILIQGDDPDLEKTVAQKIVQMYKLHPSVFKVLQTDKILTTLQGKKDYKRMEEMNFDKF
jgi:acyl-coenzyme A synthetase/AMP-(fatty) acid ligase